MASLRILVPLLLPLAMGCKGGDETTDDSDGVIIDTACDREADRDCDGWLNEDDCDPDDAYTYPGANDIPYDGKDNDCAGDGDLVDFDGDGYVSDKVEGGDDCNDGNPTIFPGATEVCYDGVDQDCAGDEDTNDCDKDGFDGRGDNATDCEDEDPAINPDATEIWYDGVDQDCTGYLTSDYDADLDGDDTDEFPNLDGEYGTDCDDTDPLTAGGSPELWDGHDRDCDGTVDDFNHRDAHTEWRPYAGLNDGFMGMGMEVFADSDGNGYLNVALSGIGNVDAEYAGRVYLLTAGTESGRPSEQYIAQIDGSAGEYFGADLANCGDMDGDGYEELLVGGILLGGEGGAWLFDGAMLAGGGDFTGSNRTAWLKGSDVYTGVDVAVMDDADGDGVAELISGQGFLGELATPAVMVYSGQDALDGGSLGPIDAMAQINITSNGGQSLGVDWNADGVGDLVTGHNTGTVNIEDPTDISGKGELLFLDGNDLEGVSIKANDTTRLVGNASPDRIGITVGVLDDIDDDGYPELLVRAYGHDGKGTQSGRVYIVDGSFMLTADETTNVEDAAEATIDGTVDYGHLMTSPHGGDFDADGLEDMLVHHPGDLGWMHAALLQGVSGVEGRSYVLWNADLVAGGSIDADLNKDQAVFKAKEADDSFGWTSDIEDLDGDGYDDVLFAAPAASSATGNAWTLINHLDEQY